MLKNVTKCGIFSDNICGYGLTGQITYQEPMKRTPIRKKKKVTKVSWRSGKVRLDAKGMEELRIECYLRSDGRCENVFSNGERCTERASWGTGEMHHMKHRSLGGSDELSNVCWLGRKCHSMHHLKGLKIVRYGIF